MPLNRPHASPLRRLGPLASHALLAASALLCGAPATGQGPGPAAAPPAPPAPSSADGDRQDYSAAERLLLMSRQLDGLKPPMQLRYRFSKRGSLEAGFTDDVALKLQRNDQGGCCKVASEFLSGARRLSLPEVEQAEGNPVILYFLEHDIREMNRLTKGSTNYFRKRIRMALYQSATVTETVVTYQGRRIPAQEIRIQPYLNDPNQARFESYVGKQYAFVLAPAVPGRVAWIRSIAPAAKGQPPLIEETLSLQGVEPATTAIPETLAGPSS